MAVDAVVADVQLAILVPADADVALERCILDSSRLPGPVEPLGHLGPESVRVLAPSARTSRHTWPCRNGCSWPTADPRETRPTSAPSVAHGPGPKALADLGLAASLLSRRHSRLQRGGDLLPQLWDAPTSLSCPCPQACPQVLIYPVLFNSLWVSPVEKHAGVGRVAARRAAGNRSVFLGAAGYGPNQNQSSVFVTLQSS